MVQRTFFYDWSGHQTQSASQMQPCAMENRPLSTLELGSKPVFDRMAQAYQKKLEVTSGHQIRTLVVVFIHSFIFVDFLT